jgi:ATP-dependent Lon protease
MTLPEIPETLPVLVLDDAVVFPGSLIHLEADDDGAKLARKLQHGLVAIALQRADSEELELHPIGVAARIERVERDGGILVHGLARIRIGEFFDGDHPTVKVTRIEPDSSTSPDIAALAHEVKKLSREILKRLPQMPQSIADGIDSMTDAGQLADLLAFRVPASVESKQRILETLDLKERLSLVVSLLAGRSAQLEVSSEIDETVQDEMTRTQREHLLRKRMEAIQKELDDSTGENEDQTDVLEERLKKAQLPGEIRAQVDKEVARLKKLPDGSAETSVSRNWLSLIADLPWGVRTEDNLDLANATGVLDADHQGLAKIKKRVLEYLAVRKLKSDMQGPLLCFVGPPGVGKTSLGKSIARAMGRKFVRVSLGGVRDEAEIRGHRRTYVGALPGRLVQALKRAGSENPVIMLDEIDKLGAAYGDPASALLEVLDREQNKAFVDHYLEVPLDLSRVLFIATANTLETLPAPLRDRIEVLELPSYTTLEKMAIARAHLLPKQLAAHGVAGAEGGVRVTLTDGALERIITGHTREAGVRGLEKRLASVCRGLAVELAEGKLSGDRLISANEIETMLGPDRFDREPLDRTAEPGVATGLAWTPVGGEVLFVEATQMPGRGKLILTGQLGSVMQESAKAALSFAQANAKALGLPEEPLRDLDLHVHVPAGGTPKDGPSAGVTLFTAIVSLLTGRRVRSDVAMTGEATLRGRVLPVGGIKEKLLAAHRNGVRRVIIPERCVRDLADLPESVRRDLTIIPVARMEEVLEAALEPLQHPLAAAA